MPSKPKYIEMGQSILKEKELKKMKELDYFGNKGKVWLVCDEITQSRRARRSYFLEASSELAFVCQCIG